MLFSKEPCQDFGFSHLADLIEGEGFELTDGKLFLSKA